MTPASAEQNESVLRLERLIAMIDDINRLKGGDRKARQLAIDRMHDELAATRELATANAH